MKGCIQTKSVSVTASHRPFPPAGVQGTLVRGHWFYSHQTQLEKLAGLKSTTKAGTWGWKCGADNHLVDQPAF